MPMSPEQRETIWSAFAEQFLDTETRVWIPETARLCVETGVSVQEAEAIWTAAHVDDFDREELMKFKDAGLDVMESKPCNIPRLFKVVDDVSPMFSDLSINAIQHSDEGHFDMVAA